MHITASWCRTCAAQRLILVELKAEPRLKDLQLLDVDFDSRKDVVKRFGATMQSTLIDYRGETEAGSSEGQTSPTAITALLDKAI